MVSGGDPPPGNYEREADVFVLRDLLQHSKNKADAEAYIQSVKRTWGMWVGIGNNAFNTLDLVAYSMFVSLFGSVQRWFLHYASVTSQKYLEHVAYVDKHIQTSTFDLTLSEALTDHYGNINSETSKVITQVEAFVCMWVGIWDYDCNTLDLVAYSMALTDHYGNINSETSMIILRLYHKTGDVHIASYDFTAKHMYVSI
eukprot:gene34520-42575_t